jgi:type IV secretory pathway VirB10-like protein
MNFNAIIAVLILKSVITEDEGERLVEHLNDKPQSTRLSDSIAAVADVIGKPEPALLPHIGPVGPAQQAEELAARQAAPTLPAAAPAPVAPPQPPADEPELPAGGETYEPETDKNAKSTSVEKPKEASAKK